MNLLTAELRRSYFNYIKNIKLTLLSIVFMVLILIFTVNSFINKLEIYHDFLTIFISLVFFLRLLLSSYTFPGNQINQEIKENRIYTLSYLKSSFEHIITARIIINNFLNLIFSVLFIILVDIALGSSFNISIYQYFVIFVISFLGMFSVSGIGLLVVLIGVVSGVKKIIITVAQIALFYLIFSFPSGSIFVPFSNSKVMIYNLLNNSYIDFNMLWMNFLYVFINSVIFYSFSLYLSKILRLIALKNNKL
ncbi:hypothetical protein NSU13_18500 [Bacillus sp. FSL M8-0049]|uniref:hypothetical protein n=1 Tax=Bacillus sp. FSL M8-0049 TaxID=2954573 RepID=UPI00315849A4